MERVSIIQGKIPILLVAPHGFNGDDENTAAIAECAKNINAYAVINRGWERGEEEVDCLRDKADCNNVNHCHEDVVKEEFLDPILRYKNKILNVHEEMYVYYIHGMSNRHRVLAENVNLDIVLGYGAGAPNSYSCELWRKNLFLSLLNDAGFTAYEGKKQGAMSGWSRNNMNQLFRKWYPDSRVHSMQLEIIYDRRKSGPGGVLTTGNILTSIMVSMLQHSDFTTLEVFNSY